MRILSISLKNIKSHRNCELSFVSGINVLSGPNGAGKSTVFEAIGYALFGVDARDFVGNIDRFVSIGEKKGEVSVTFATGEGKIFRVTRTVGAGSKWLLAEKTGESFEFEDHAGAPETEARIKELLGLDSGRSLADQFKLVIGPFQHEFLGPFVLMQPKKRQEAFDEILGIDAWRKTYKGTVTLQSAVKSRIEVLTVEIAGKEEQLSILPEREKELVDLISEAKEYQNQAAKKQTVLDETSLKLIKLDELEKSVSHLKTEIKVLENRITDGREKIEDQQKLVAEAEKALEILEKSRQGKKAFEEAEKKLTILRKKDQERRDVEKDINTLENESNRLGQTLKHELQEVDRNDSQLAEDEKQIRNKLQSFSADEKIISLAARLPDLRKEIEKLRSAKGLLEGKKAGLKEGKKKLTEGICPFFNETCLNIADKSPRDVFTSRIEEIDQESLDLAGIIEELNQQVAVAENAKQQLDSFQARKQELDEQLKNVAEKQKENNNRRKKLEEIRSKQSEAEHKVTARKKDLDQFKELDEKIKTVEKQRIEHQAVRDAFFTNQKIARERDNRRLSLKKMMDLFDELQQALTERKNDLGQLVEKYNPVQHNEVRQAKEKLVMDMATLKQQIDNLSRNSTRLEEEIKKLKLIKKEISQLLEQKKSYKAKEELVKFLRNRIFNNVSDQLSERFREEISLRADSIYHTISEADEELSWGEKYQIVLRDMDGEQLRERTDDQLSGGQIMSAVVALRLALLQTIGAKIAFFDEPTSNLDATRRENLAHAFRAIDVGREEVTEHWYDQLFLISHDVAFTEITDQVISLG